MVSGRGEKHTMCVCERERQRVVEMKECEVLKENMQKLIDIACVYALVYILYTSI